MVRSGFILLQKIKAMREHKFRAWNNKSNEYHYLASNQMSAIHLVMNNELWSVFDAETRLCGSCDESGVLEQFIGFTDKNGKEIYSGDIDGNMGLYINWNQLHCCYGLYSKKHFFTKEIQADEYDDKGELLKPWQCISIEVVGTIHEDKHLLK